MSERPQQNGSTWHPAEDPSAWRTMSKPTAIRRRVKLRPTLPKNVPQAPSQTGGWHLPNLEQTTARPAPTAASPEAIALGLIPEEAEVEVAAPENIELADAEEAVDVDDVLRPEDVAQDATPEDSSRPEDVALAASDESDAALRPEDVAIEPAEDELDDVDVTAALDELEDDEEDAFTMSELLALQSLADESADGDVSQGESLELGVVPSDAQDDIDAANLSPAERAAMGLEPQTPEGATVEAEIEPDTVDGEPATADQFDYASQLAALEGGDGGEDAPEPGQTVGMQPVDTDSDPGSYAQQQLAALQGDGGDDPFDQTQTYQDTPAAPAEPIDEEAEAFAQQFNRTEAQVRELRQQRDTGMIPQEQFESALRELMIFDQSEGVWWMMGADTEIWYKYDNNSGQWIVAEPPMTAAERAQQQQNIMTPDSNLQQVDLEDSLPRVGTQDATDEWGYSQQGDPQFGDSYQMPRPAQSQDAQSTVVGDAAFKDQLDSAAETVPGMGAVDMDSADDYVEPVAEPAPDYEEELEDDLSTEIELAKRRRNRQLVTTVAAVVGVLTGIALLAAAGVSFYVYSQYQGIKTEWEGDITAFGQFETEFQTVIIQDINGNEIARLRSQEGGDRTNVDLQNVSPEMIHATVSTENERFFTDAGWDPIAIARAFLTNVTAGEIVSGGSTITQQLARNIILRQDNRSFASDAQRKLHEIVISHELAQRYGKNRILEVYLNEIYFGNQKYGVEAAAEFYFDKPAANLNLGESALLAGLIQAPAANDPVTNPRAAFDRMDEVVRLMTEAGNGSGCLPIPFQNGPFCVTNQTLEGQAAINIAVVKTTIYLPEESSVAYPHFVTFVQQQLQTQFTQEEIFRRGFVVRTTLRPSIQDSAQNSLANYVDSIGTTGVNTGTSMVTNPDTGAIYALIGSPDFNDETIDGQVNLALSWQQPGSAIKPVTYAGTLDGWQTEAGPNYMTPATILWDVPTTYGDAQNTVITNFDGTYRGPVSLRNALQNSYNVPAVRAFADLGTENFRQAAQAMGIRFLPEAQFNLTTALGSTEVRLYDMMEAYGTLSNDGVMVPLYAIEEITDGAGNPVEWLRDEPSRAISEPAAFLMQNIMSDDAARQPAFGANNRLAFSQFPGQVAAKTGTSNEGRDLWTIGYTDNVVVGVWLGHVDNNPTFNTSGYITASPLWRTITENVLSVVAAPSAWDTPANVIQTQYCATTGTLVDESGQIPCNDVRTGYFISGQLPPPPSEGFITQVQVYTWTGERANEFCPNDRETITVANFSEQVNAPELAWLRTNPQGRQIATNLGLPEGVPTVPQAECGANTQLLQASLTQPQQGSVVADTPVTIQGSISSAPNFSSYDLQVASANTPNQFTIVDGPFQNLPTGGQLGTWDAGTAADGRYILRLAMNSSNGGYAYRDVEFTLDKPEPTATPTSPPVPTPPPIGGNPGNGGNTPPTPTLIPFDSSGTLGGSGGGIPTPTATIDFGG